MNKADYEKARKREITSLDDLDGGAVRRIVSYLRDNHSLKQAADRFTVPIHVVREIARHIGR